MASQAYSLTMILAVASGGALGAVMRYLSTSLVGHLVGPGFPWGTIVVNVVGSFIMGAFIEAMALVWTPTMEVRALVVTGILGAFTTFSTFSLDAYSLFIKGDYTQAGLYVFGSVLLGILALLAGLIFVRQVLA